jgi:ferredoxin
MENMDNDQVNRRDFLKLAAVGVAVAAGTQAIKPAEASSGAPKGNHSWAMVIDQSKCTGCEYCTLACRAHNDVPPDISWNEVQEAGQVGENMVYIARPCMHCENAPCVDVCMVKASYYRDDGLVMMDYDFASAAITARWPARTMRVPSTGKIRRAQPAVPQWGSLRSSAARCVPRSARSASSASIAPELGFTPGVDDEVTPPPAWSARPTHASWRSERSQLERQPGAEEQPSYRLRETLEPSRVCYFLRRP